ncbi:MAG: hypothetical protein M1825_003145 [Sarcosagium campestre]|nr:MAG: hypothetical protein M1825_003145 [Sarcosagium campestre]
MADADGMLLNFSIGEAPLNHPRPSFKGGHWKDRLSAKRLAQRQHSSRPLSAVPAGRTFAQGVNAESVDSKRQGRLDQAHRPQKRQKVGEDFAPAATKSAATETASTPRTKFVELPNTKSREVISSLFSYNPTAQSAPAAQNPEAPAAQPSNAPLPDGISTFTSLGLSTALSAHLLIKLKVKAPTAIQKAAIPQLVKDDSDAFIQAETGSGKTLAYLLPIVERIMHMSKEARPEGPTKSDGKVHRDSGLFAIILAPTRELCRQISAVLNSLLRCAHWIVASTVIGGEKKKSEKARLRKGINILLATPGRLADHLNNTRVLDVSNVRWLVLDEGDRLMELGFEEEIQGIVTKLEQRSRIRNGSTSLPSKRVTVLCSATMKMNVQRLGEISLRDAVHLQGEGKDGDVRDGALATKVPSQADFVVPAQLQQTYTIVPAKLRLVTLASVLRRAFQRTGTGTKAIVFFSCADSVDFHFELLTRPRIEPKDVSSAKTVAKTAVTTTSSSTTATLATVTSAPGTFLDTPLSLHRLHGSLTQALRTSTLATFTHSTTPSILLATDVASRGLDLPNISLVIEYDPPFSRDDHLHRVGRTARAGQPGRALIFLQPGPEEGYVDVIKSASGGGGDALASHVARRDADDLLKKGFGSAGLGAGADWEQRATEWQLAAERWVLDDAHGQRALDLARQAFQSHVRAYATHVAAERGMFDIKALHLGHLAKSFALRERPGKVNVAGLRGAASSSSTSARRISGGGQGVEGSRMKRRDADPEVDRQAAIDAQRKMKAKVKEHMSGISEFNIG